MRSPFPCPDIDLKKCHTNCYSLFLYPSGWTMVFKAVSGCDEIAHEVYTSSETYAEYEMDALDVTNRYTNDYKNRIVLNWCRFGASEVSIIYLMFTKVKRFRKSSALLF